LLIEHGAADAVFWRPARLGVESAWYGHVPFAHWLVTVLRPRLVVELGTHNGVSFAAFCEAVRRLSLPCRCIAIDMWEGDAHAGYYGESVYRDLAGFTARHYSGFATLLRASFAAALPQVADGSIDLLHVDGRHRYEDVREDYESWRPKLSPRAVVLFHDVRETRQDFGVHRYWAELIRQTPHFTFDHAHGLGVLAPGAEPPEAAELLCALRHTPAAETLRDRFAALGARWVAEMRVSEGEAAATGLRAHAARLQSHIDKLAAYTAELERQARPGLQQPSPGSQHVARLGAVPPDPHH
jgi:predicted O-methyltransferase YrrM